MVVAGLTITSHREEVVDFTVPFFEETSAVLVRVNLTKEEDLWKYFFVPLKVNHKCLRMTSLYFTRMQTILHWLS